MNNYTLYETFLNHLREHIEIPKGDSLVIEAAYNELSVNGNTLPTTGNALWKTLDEYYILPKGIKEFTITAEKDSVVEMSYVTNLQRNDKN